MTNSTGNNQPLLPTKTIAGGATAGEWKAVEGISIFKQVGEDLDLGMQGDREINSIPTPWSRALQLLSAVRNSKYPTRAWLISQYRGFLATLALADNLCLKVEAKKIDLNEVQNHPFGQALYRLRPNENDSLYAGMGTDAWAQLFAFTLEGKVLGFSSPATLIVPASRLDRQIDALIPWVRDGYFQDPVGELTQQQKQIVASWIQNLRHQVVATSTNSGNSQLGGYLAQVLDDFRQNLVGNQSVDPAVLSNNAAPYGTPLAPPLLRALHPSQQQAQPSNVQLVPSRGLDPANRVYIYDPIQMPALFGRRPQDIVVVGTIALAAFNPTVGQTLDPSGLFKQPLDLFTEKLLYIKGEDVFSGSWTTKKLRGMGYSILLPLQSWVREYFSSQDLEERVQLDLINTDEGPGLRVTLKLELSGFDGQTNNYVCFKDFVFDPDNEIKQDIPNIAVWPFIPSSTGWKDYYLLVETTDANNFAFTIEQPVQSASPSRSQDTQQSFQHWRCENLPQVLVALDRDGRELGLLPLSQPSLMPSGAGQWTVGVDFGTSLTNIAVRKGNGAPEILKLETLSQVISKGFGTDKSLRNFFVPQFFSDEECPPLSTILTTQGATSIQPNQTLSVVTEGRVYVPASSDLDDLKPAHIRTNIKWENLEFQKPFLNEILYLISAHAALEGVTSINWKVSYPTAFSRIELENYKTSWRLLVNQLIEKTGQKHIFDPLNGLETESVTFAKYCADIVQKPLTNTTCIDIGGGTSDISVWQNGKLVHQSSVPFAGRDIFHKILSPSSKRNKLDKLDAIFGLPPAQAEKVGDALKSQSSNFNAALDTYLRRESQRLLGDNYLTVFARPDRPDNKRFRSLIAFSIGGLYHYLGIILASLKDRGLMEHNQTTTVLVGGNGSRFLAWINPNGVEKNSEINILLEEILSRSAGTQQNPLGSEVSTKPKAEACLGLVVDESSERLEGPENDHNDGIIVGLPCVIKGKSGSKERIFEYSSIKDSLNFDQQSSGSEGQELELIEHFTITDYSEIERYINNFDQVIREKRIESLHSPFDRKGKKVTHLSPEIQSILEQYIQPLLAKKKVGITDFEPEPPFLIALRCLIRVLAEEWADS
ncbi:hypothetical protein [Synechococcus elongatus]|uniref:Uncharacterized protein n=1 Tax=Synechococcus elongatus PCC 11802 TaxID=2283154 RepID=A0AAT9JY31_SYNEL|nr:hypothetical protein [Synechococcus elongatus]QFZ91807.1 hypothetical protein EKO22_04860 [Synechococcus elongatus PCC 11802]